MISKNIIQYLLLIALVILSIFFYKKYIETDKDVSQKQSEIQKNTKILLMKKMMKLLIQSKI